MFWNYCKLVRYPFCAESSSIPKYLRIACTTRTVRVYFLTFLKSLVLIDLCSHTRWKKIQLDILFGIFLEMKCLIYITCLLAYIIYGKSSILFKMLFSNTRLMKLFCVYELGQHSPSHFLVTASVLGCIIVMKNANKYNSTHIIFPTLLMNIVCFQICSSCTNS